MRENTCKSVSGKGLTPRIHKELSQLIKNKTSLVMRDMPIKPTVRDYFITPRTAKLKRTDNDKCW